MDKQQHSFIQNSREIELLQNQKSKTSLTPPHTSYFWSLESLFIKSALLELLRPFSQSEFTLYIGKLKCFKVENSPPKYLDLIKMLFFHPKEGRWEPYIKYIEKTWFQKNYPI